MASAVADPYNGRAMGPPKVADGTIFPADQRAAAARLSPRMSELLDRVEAEPELLARRSFESTFAAARKRIPVFLGFDPEAPYGLQPWPVLLSPRREAELARAGRGLTRLMRSIPRRFFDDDPAALHRFYGLESEMLAILLLNEPLGVDEAISRLDMVDTADGVKCVELNCGNPASWQNNAVSQAMREQAPFSDLLAGDGVRWIDTSERLIRHAVTCAAAAPELAGDELNLAIVVATHGARYSLDNHPVDHYRECFRRALAEEGGGRRGRLHVVTNDRMELEGGRLTLAGDPVHAVVGDVDERSRAPLFRAFKAGHLVHLSSPIGPLVLGDKRNLALLSENVDSGVFDAEERAVVERYVPWTRRVVADAASSLHGGPERPLPELLLARRGELVLKGALSVGGEAVVVGRAVTEPEWRRAVEAALDDGGWIVQEYLESTTYPLQCGDEGWAPHRVVWGPFVFGDEYAGLYVRVLPVDAGPVVNMGTGARVALAFVVEG